ncbi:MAG: glycoside hydrolase family 92 protein, partial [Bacteroidales bacterium]|nr:glycoside hydrolase family 92 protein [Bacteroidales bacterium]
MKKYTLYTSLVVIILNFCFCTRTSVKDTDVIKYIHPIIGASTSQEAGRSGHGLGKTFPGSATPFGLVQLSPDTKTGGDNGPGYSWHHKTIEGFSFIHMSGIGWYGEFGNFLVIPNTGKLLTAAGDEKNPETGYRSRFSHETEIAEAGYYAVNLDDYGIRTELTSSPHAGIIRITYPRSDSARISIDLARRIGGSASEQYIRIVDQNTIEGWMRCTSRDGGWGNGDGNVNYTVYFYCQLDKPLKNTGIWSAEIPEKFTRRNLQAIESKEFKEAVANAEVFNNRKEMQGKHLGFFSEFTTQEKEQVLLKAGISFVSIDGAKANLETEIPDWNFDRVRKNNNDLWRTAFKNIEVKGGSEAEKTIFYTALYHTMIDPRSTSDVTGQYIGGDGNIHQSDKYVYRTIF